MTPNPSIERDVPKAASRPLARRSCRTLDPTPATAVPQAVKQVFNRLRFPAAFFFAASLLVLLQLYYAIGGSGSYLAISALAYGLVLGFVVQICVREKLPMRRVGLAAFLGAFTLWLPVVLVTYGFALAATPIFLGYAGAVVLGVFAASRVQKAHALRSDV